MLRSMTGFGRGTYEEENFSITMEVKTVNHRYTELALRMPALLNPVEDRIRKEIGKYISRGRVDMYVTVSYTAPDACRVVVDENLARSYHQALLALAGSIGADQVQLGDRSELLYLAKTPNVLTVQQGQFDTDAYWPKVQQALDQALTALVAMRTTEGENIKGDFLHRADLIEEYLAQIEARSPQVTEAYEQRLQERLTALLEDKKVALDPDRVLQEVAFFADRTSITEECVRLHSHLRQFREMLQSDVPVGRKLDFLIQEFNREANTIASKCSDFALAQVCVNVKAEIEKIREQVQNIE